MSTLAMNIPAVLIRLAEMEKQRNDLLAAAKEILADIDYFESCEKLEYFDTDALREAIKQAEDGK